MDTPASHIGQQSVDTALRALGSRPGGLGPAEIARRLTEFGPNRVAPVAARSLLFAGTAIVAGECTAAVFATGMHTEFGRIAQLTDSAGETESPLQREIRRVSRPCSARARSWRSPATA